MDDESFSLAGSLVILKRRMWFFLVPFFLVLGLAITMAYSLPAVYQSTGTILIEHQGLPTDLVRSTVSSYAQERIALVRQRVMAASNLIAIMDEHGLYREIRKGQDDSAALQQMRSDTALEVETMETVDPLTNRPTSATISFSVSFQADSPEVAQAVAKDLVALYLAENQRERQEVTQEASRFLEQEASRLSNQIEKLEKGLAAFKTEAGVSLPEMREANLGSMQRTNDRLRDIDQSINALTESSIILEGELARTEPYLQFGSMDWEGQRILPPAEQLKMLEAQSVALSARYSAEHPDRLKVEREIRALRAAVKNGSIDESALGAKNPAYIQLESRLIANQAQLNSLTKSRVELEEQLKGYEERLAQAPSIEQQYLGMMRDYQSAVDRYRDVSGKLAQAKLAETLESESKGERFTLIDPPRLSEIPIQPNRPAMIFLGFVLATGSGFGSVVLRQALDKGIYNARTLARITGSPPLATIPFIETTSTSRWDTRWPMFIVAIVGAILAAALIVHLTVAPLNVLLGQ
jgi:polysaccharide biosynthesis transport protein